MEPLYMYVVEKLIVILPLSPAADLPRMIGGGSWEERRERSAWAHRFRDYDSSS